jgi:PBP1b-binding outer membrane lipoprotein LpoB
MDCEKVALFILMLAVLVLTGCGRGARKDVAQKPQDDMNCVKRADLKLIAAALNKILR